MEELEIVGWTDFDSEYPTKVMNGDEMSAVLELLRKEILEKKYCFSGTIHQYSSTGVPVFSDGTCLRASMRSWGYIMAAIYMAIESSDLSYMDFYMESPREKVLPEYKDFSIKPCIVEDERPGMILQEDIDLISTSIKNGIELMTFDKVIKRYMELIQK